MSETQGLNASSRSARLLAGRDQATGKEGVNDGMKLGSEGGGRGLQGPAPMRISIGGASVPSPEVDFVLPHPHREVRVDVGPRLERKAPWLDDEIEPALELVKCSFGADQAACCWAPGASGFNPVASTRDRSSPKRASKSTLSCFRDSSGRSQ